MILTSSCDMSKPSFEILIPLADDAAFTADVHLRAMADDTLTRAQFPSPEALDFFRQWLTKNTLEHIWHSDKGVLIARNPATGELASFIKWLEYGPGGEVDLASAATTLEDEWPESCGRSILDEYRSIAAGIRRRILGRQGYFHVTYLCTDPKWGRRGAASALLRELEHMADDAGKAIVLESVVSAVPLYKRLGFETRQVLQMVLPSPGSTERTERYSEQTM
ncbi:hypothetical protein ED733_001948 [Metarhizium rileyi]|nr:hypothetical protein ED733_001948 [Metarhizium rileyi]